MSLPNRKFTAVELVPGTTYRVKTAFKDFDHISHNVGDSWRFVSKDFLPYDDGLTVHIERDGMAASIRLQWRDDAQGQIVDDFSDYVEEVQ